jgi:sporulation protein YabP
MNENKSIQTTNKPNAEHNLILTNRKHLTISGIDKVISVKPDLLQLKSNNGDIMITGQNIEVVKLDLEQKNISLDGKFDSIKYIENNKTPFLKKIFK